MSLYDHRPTPILTRRDLLSQCGMGLGALSLATILGQSAIANPQSAINPLAPKPPHFRPRAKRIIHFFLNGGPSHVDTFDPKPLLAKYDGKPVPSHLPTERKTGSALPSPFAFKRYGQSGLEISELFEKTAAAHADDLCVIRSMKAQVPNHEPSLMLMNCGDAQMARPSVGSWITYGLGTENQNLPGFVALCPGGYPIKEAENWRAGFLPGVYQGTYIDSQHTKLEKLIENIRNDAVTPSAQRRQLDLLGTLNAAHQHRHAREAAIEARIQSFELAYRMQAEAADAFDVSKEPQAVRDLYGDMKSVHARQTLIARRLLERGVRVVQLWHGAGQPWDNHADIKGNHAKLARQLDQPLAALLTDLKRLGMLDDTLVLWGGEFGRTPTVELGGGGKATAGRDHNPYGFSVFLAGGGVKGGTTYGATDDFGFAAVDKVTEVHDLHATLLHLLGFDHERLTYRYAGRDFRLTDVSGHVLTDILA